ncbi:hypothetical protein ACQKP5_15795 [Pseudomonas vancouverensis]|uniref:hypothetical protein n=1 Tax=Pseudomonas vancouverensis TaxID=95300 RepID=UPI003D0326B3
MILPTISTGGRAAQARLNAEKAAEHPQPQAEADIDLDDSGTAAAAQRLVQISDEMSAALAQFRGRRLGDQLLEFDVETSRQKLEPRLLASLANLPESVRSLDKALIYKEVSGANGLAFSLDLFVKSYMREVFEPKGDDAWENTEW